MPTKEQIDEHLDAILRASGSALRHFSLQKPKDDMRTALTRFAELVAAAERSRMAKLCEDRCQTPEGMFLAQEIRKVTP